MTMHLGMTFEWVVMQTECDVHIIPQGDITDHWLNGLKCRCTPEIRKTEDGVLDAHGYPVKFVVMHRPWVWQAPIPSHMPEELE